MGWYRLCIDVDLRGAVVGWSMELHSERDGLVEVISSTVGPFDEPAEVHAQLVESALGRWGVHLTLF